MTLRKLYHRWFGKEPTQSEFYRLRANANLLRRAATKGGRNHTRAVVRFRDKYKCQSCGKKWKKGKRAFDIHHLNGICGKKSKSYDSIKNLEGLITLCHACHLNLDEVRNKMSEGILKSYKEGNHTSSKKTLRNQSIIKMRKAGATLASIGIYFDITRQRVWKICK